ncbi:hypothetical protein V502_07158 [Pseudogymnoascus sp. VKM F-4520 (FW-2644)]|nr:hypothetical protein V502_07158 [Pseudogymnoascus sp. VKM F-4520 (FW-2644)]
MERRPLRWPRKAWAYDELAMYEAAIAAGGPLPEPPRFLIPSARKQSLRSAARGQRIAMQHMEMLRTLTRNSDVMMLNRGLEVDLAYLRHAVRRARRELDVADSVKEAAQSTSLPGGVGGRAVGKAPVTGEEYTANEGTIARDQRLGLA